MNMVAPSPAVPNLLDGGGLLNPTPSGMPAQLQLNHEPVVPQNQTPDFSSGLYIKKSYNFCSKLLANFFSVIEGPTLISLYYIRVMQHFLVVCLGISHKSLVVSRYTHKS